MNIKMDKIIISSIIILASIIDSSSSECVKTNYVSDCEYTILCHEEPHSMGFEACYDDSYVTFVMMNSVLDLLDMYFFRLIGFTERVTEFVGVDNSWTKVRGGTFTSFPNTVRFDLSSNNIVTVMGEAFIECRSMKFLNLSSNSIESLYHNSFEIYVNRLEELDLSHNKLKYIGREFSNIPNLTKLYLNNNQISKVASDAFQNLNKLNYLHLQQNFLTSVESSLTNLESLLTLDIANNYLTKLSADDIVGLVSITYLNISHNELISVESNCFSNAKQLQSADFSFNKIEIVIDEHMFINNHKLNYLNFYNNKILDVHANAFKHCNLSYLNLENNNIVGKPLDILTILRNSTGIHQNTVNGQERSPVIESKNNTGVNQNDSVDDEKNLLHNEIQAINIKLEELESKLLNEIHDLRVVLMDALLKDERKGLK